MANENYNKKEMNVVKQKLKNTENKYVTIYKGQFDPETKKMDYNIEIGTLKLNNIKKGRIDLKEEILYGNDKSFDFKDPIKITDMNGNLLYTNLKEGDFDGNWINMDAYVTSGIKHIPYINEEIFEKKAADWEKKVISKSQKPFVIGITLKIANDLFKYGGKPFQSIVSEIEKLNIPLSYQKGYIFQDLKFFERTNSAIKEENGKVRDFANYWDKKVYGKNINTKKSKQEVTNFAGDESTLDKLEINKYIGSNM